MEDSDTGQHQQDLDNRLPVETGDHASGGNLRDGGNEPHRAGGEQRVLYQRGRNAQPIANTRVAIFEPNSFKRQRCDESENLHQFPALAPREPQCTGVDDRHVAGVKDVVRTTGRKHDRREVSSGKGQDRDRAGVVAKG